MKIYYAYKDKSYSHEFLFFILKNYYDITAIETDLKKTELGKLYIENSPIKFNLSHSDNVIAIAFCENELGFDVEKLRDLSYSKLSQRCFGTTPQNAEEFFELWTKAESFVKFKAKSILAELKDIEIEDNAITYKGEKQSLFVKTGRIDDFIYTAICEQYKEITVIDCSKEF